MKILVKAYEEDPDMLLICQNDTLYATAHSDLFLQTPFGKRLEAGEVIEFELVEVEQ